MERARNVRFHVVSRVRDLVSGFGHAGNVLSFVSSRLFPGPETGKQLGHCCSLRWVWPLRRAGGLTFLCGRAARAAATLVLERRVEHLLDVVDEDELERVACLGWQVLEV